MSKQILNEIYVSKLALKENKESKNKAILCTVEGPFASIGPSRNGGRRYTEELWNGVVNSEYYKEQMENGGIPGEARHPKNRDEVEYPEISHVIRKLEVRPDKGCLWGEADILNTPAGNIIKTVIDCGLKVGVSARALGSVLESMDGPVVDASSYEFITFDFVTTPGFRDSRVELKESWNRGDGSLPKKLIESAKVADLNTLSVLESLLEILKSEDISELKEAIEHRKKELHSVEDELEALRTKNKSLLEEVGNYKKVKEEDNLIIKRLYERLKKPRQPKKSAKVLSLLEQVTKSDAIIEGLKKDLLAQTSKTEKLKKEIEVLQVKIETINEQKKNLEERLKKVVTKNQRLTQYNDDLKEQFNLREATLNESKENLEKAQKEIVRLEEQLEKEKISISNLKESLKEYKIHEKRISKLREDNRSRRASLITPIGRKTPQADGKYGDEITDLCGYLSKI